MCVVERKVAWELEQRRVTRCDQNKLAPKYRATFPKAKAVFSQTLQVVCADGGRPSALASATSLTLAWGTSDI